MAITAKDVMALRQRTGLGMMECKSALNETDGDIDKAIDLLRQKGLAKMDSRSNRESAEGKIAAAMSTSGDKGAIIEINTETDFTAGNQEFVSMTKQVAQMALEQGSGEVQKTEAIQALIDNVRLTTKENVQFGRGTVLGSANSRVGSYVHFTGKVGVLVEAEGDLNDALIKDLCMHISAISPIPLGITESDIPEDIVAKEKEIAKAQAMESGKPENIAEKMVEGKIRKFFDETVLLRQTFIKDETKKIKDILPDGCTIRSFVRYQVGG